ncbi:beta-lactoglobulin I [Burkholderia ambifaria]|jgi:hypothetical protein|uniref:beta-lactoglobulin I n=1 Tax=Burkholderia ambifaria TaxID=152480 RepID=UPI000D010E7F|nr:beta-lactoglobulin I [Burkholderia ambifaria]PRF97447.1 beta-lactoglobulin I [Burkholderia ambifaria]
MLYAILTSKEEAPIGYFDSAFAPTVEELADYCAEFAGFANRDDWMEATGVDAIAYAPVH